MKKNIVIVILSIIVLCLGSYLVYDKVLGNDDNNNNNWNIINHDKLKNISNIKISNPCSHCFDPDYRSITINDISEISYILENLEKNNFVDEVPNDVGFGFPFAIEVNYKDTKVDTYYFLSNNKLVIRYAGEESYNEYELKNKNFKNELIEKYFNN